MSPASGPAAGVSDGAVRTRVLWAAGALALVWVATLVTVLVTVPLSHSLFWLELSAFGADAVTTLVCVYAGLAARRAERRWRLFLALTTGCLAAGSASTLWFSPVAIGVPSGLVSRAVPLAAPTFLIAALLIFPSRRSSGRLAGGVTGGETGFGWGRTVLLDSLVVIGAVWLVAWDGLLAPVFHADHRAAGWVLHLITVVLLVLVVIVLVVIGVFREPGNRRAWALLATGLVTVTVPSATVVYLSATRTFSVPIWYFAGYTAGPLLVAFSVLVAGGVERVRSVRTQRLAVWAHAVLPYPFVAAAGVAVLLTRLRGLGMSRVDILLGPTLLALVGIRQLLTVADNTRLVFRVREGQQELRQQAFHDSLTGLANRALFRDRLEHAVAIHRRELRPLALLFLDLDGFKGVNDRLGHAAGDALLRGVAERLQRATRESDTVARLGGDEFGILLEGERDAVQLGERLVQALHVPYRLENDVLCVAGASVGLVVASLADRHLGPEALLRQADIAMYAAKARGKGTLVRYRPDLTGADGGLDLRTGLALALAGDPAGGTLGVDYQPIVTLADGRTRAVEALARWTHPTQGAMSPTLFVPAAEQAGLIGALDTFVLDRACADIGRLVAAHGSAPVVHVNVSATRVGDDTFPGTVEAALRRYGLPPSALIVEITETGQIPDLRGAAKALGRLAEQGVRIALDDIGTGRTAVAALHLLPVHIIKLDRSLIAGSCDQRTVALRTGLVTLAHSLKMLVVAEGIETVGQRDAAVAAACDLGQGFWFALPGPLTATEATVAGSV